MTRQVHDVRAAFGHQVGQLLEATQLGELDGHARQPGRGPQHGVFLALVVELGLVDRGGRQEHDAERTRPQRAVGLVPSCPAAIGGGTTRHRTRPAGPGPARPAPRAG